MVLGALVITSEYSTGMIRTSLAVMPRRGVLYAAKAIVFAAVTLTISLVTSFVAFFVGQAILSGKHYNTTLAQPGVLRAVLLSAAIVTVFGLLAYGAGALIRHSAGAITSILGVIFLIPALAQALPNAWFADLVRWLPGGEALEPHRQVRAAASPTTCSPPGVSSPCSPATRWSCSPSAPGRSSAAMREETAQDQAGYPGPVEWLYAWLRRHPWLVDGTLAVVLLAGAANAYLVDAAVLPASLALAGTVAVRRRFPVAAYAVALAIGVAQVIVGIGPTFTDSPLQPTFADAGILVLLYTVAAERPRRVSLPGLAACVVLFLAVVVRYNPGGNQPRHQLEFFLVTALALPAGPGERLGARRLDGLPAGLLRHAGGTRRPGRAGAGRPGADRRRGRTRPHRAGAA